MQTTMELFWTEIVYKAIDGQENIVDDLQTFKKRYIDMKSDKSDMKIWRPYDLQEF